MRSLQNIAVLQVLKDSQTTADGEWPDCHNLAIPTSKLNPDTQKNLPNKQGNLPMYTPCTFKLLNKTQSYSMSMMFIATI